MPLIFSFIPLGCRRITHFQNSFRLKLCPHPQARSFTSVSCSASPPSSTKSPLRNIHYTPQYSSGADGLEDTIYALATGPTSAAGVAIMRISGPAAPHALLSLLNPPTRSQQQNKKPINLPPPRMATLRTLYDPKTSEILDKALILFFSHPHSFTTEHVVELHLHGSRAVISAVTKALSRVPSPTPRPANRGEFTRRAYENGAMDLISAEGLADLIAADTSSQRIQALRALSGDASIIVQSWRERLIRSLAHVEAVLDFSEDVGDSPLLGLCGDILILRDEMIHHLSKGNRAEVVRTGASIALVGPPNAGKSSLLNALAKRDAAIVAPTAGTTRDIVSVRMDFAGIAATVSDTAGLRASPADAVEAEGMRRARNAASSADVIICVHDASTQGDELDQNLKLTLDAVASNSSERSELKGGDRSDTKYMHEETVSSEHLPHILYVFNKTDLCTPGCDIEGTINRSARPHSIDTGDMFHTSLIHDNGVTELLSRIETVLKSRLETDDSHSAEAAPVITRARHRHHVEKAVSSLSAFLDGQAPKDEALRMPMDLAAEDLRASCKEVGAITGDVDAEEILDVIFNEFCIGK